VRAALASVANTVIIPMQDYLELGANARINTPSTLGVHNWSFRFTKEQFTKELAQNIKLMARTYARGNANG
jgi:4-alpha-glucanotransferase